MFKKIGATRLGVWMIKHIISPLDRWLYRLTGGKMLSTGAPLSPVLLLTTTGWKSGKERTIPVFYLQDKDRLIVCNVNPGFEKTNPWVLNLRARPKAYVQVGSERYPCQARLATPSEIEQYWPLLVRMWPAYQTHFERSGKRTVFILEKENPSQC